MSSAYYTDYIFSSAIGIVLFVVIMKYGSGKTAKLKVDDDVDPILEQSERVTSINESQFIAKNAKLQKMFKLTDDQMKEAIQSTNRDLRKSPLDDEVSWFSIVDKIIYLLLFVFLLIAVNILSHGELGRVLLGFFPAEFESLKLTEYLEKFHLIHKLHER